MFSTHHLRNRRENAIHPQLQPLSLLHLSGQLALQKEDLSLHHIFYQEVLCPHLPPLGNEQRTAMKYKPYDLFSFGFAEDPNTGLLSASVKQKLAYVLPICLV